MGDDKSKDLPQVTDMINQLTESKRHFYRFLKRENGILRWIWMVEKAT